MKYSVVYERSKKFYEFLLENEMYELDEIYLKKLIAKHLGADKLTIKKYMNCLIGFKFIKWSDENKNFIVIQND